MADIQSVTAKIRRGKKIEERRRKKPQDKNIMPPLHRAAINSDHLNAIEAVALLKSRMTLVVGRPISIHGFLP